ncbi:MAG: hypothetical protein KAU26_00710, partial [Methylococcales bacterium]|nr:hypothetical protein [Methylococcales bacterium]
MKKLNATAITTAIISTLGVSATLHAESNPFAMSVLSDGYMQLAKADTTSAAPESTSKKSEASCGEGKCGDMMKDGKMKKGQEAACGEMMKGKQGACGMGKKAKEGKCGEG